MKTIVYSIIAIFIFCAVASGYANKADSNYSILIQATDKNITSLMLSQSAEIISGRLRDFGSEMYDVTVIPEKSQIQIMFTDTPDLKAIEPLLVQKGRFAFYETYDRNSLAELLQDDNQLFSLMKDGDANKSAVKIGCTTSTGVAQVNDYISSLGSVPKCKFVWSQDLDISRICLYALRLYNEKGSLLAGSDVESMKYYQDQASKTYDVEIQFRKEVIKIWSDASKRNINKTIALVRDDKVIFCPRVNEVINSGKCIISGDFTEYEVRIIAALGNNGELPANFEILQ